MVPLGTCQAAQETADRVEATTRWHLKTALNASQRANSGPR